MKGAAYLVCGGRNELWKLSLVDVGAIGNLGDEWIEEVNIRVEILGPVDSRGEEDSLQIVRQFRGALSRRFWEVCTDEGARESEE